MPKVKKLVSIVVPVFNEEKNVQPLYDAVTAVMATIADPYHYEFAFTDNHSTARSFQLLQGLGERDGRFRGLRFSRNFGFPGSIFTGFVHATGHAALPFGW